MYWTAFGDEKGQGVQGVPRPRRSHAGAPRVGRPVDHRRSTTTGRMMSRPTLEAVGSLIKLEARRAALLGLDAPRRTAVRVITEDAVDQEIERLQAALGDRADGVVKAPAGVLTSGLSLDRPYVDR
jgi:hypothetical protein